ncbi:MAG: hypothetical protein AAGF83_12590 [Cyanobacteria bacterium P01_G01_bin.67]
MTSTILIGAAAETRMPQSQSWNWIPTHLTIEQFALPHLCHDRNDNNDVMKTTQPLTDNSYRMLLPKE